VLTLSSCSGPASWLKFVLFGVYVCTLQSGFLMDPLVITCYPVGYIKAEAMVLYPSSALKLTCVYWLFRDTNCCTVSYVMLWWYISCDIDRLI